MYYRRTGRFGFYKPTHVFYTRLGTLSIYLSALPSPLLLHPTLPSPVPQPPSGPGVGGTWVEVLQLLVREEADGTRRVQDVVVAHRVRGTQADHVQHPQVDHGEDVAVLVD